MNISPIAASMSVNNLNANLKKTSSKNQAPVDYPQIQSLPMMTFTGARLPKVEKIFTELQSNDMRPEIFDEIENLSDDNKADLIKKYCNHTGFGDLCLVNKKMKNYARTKIDDCAKKAGVKVLSAGYHRTCSANVNAALPGSDLDAMSVIVTGNQDRIDNFKGYLWRGFDPTIVSIRKDLEFPDIFSIDQLYEWTKLTDRLILEAGLDSKTAKYQRNLSEKEDFEAALEFNIDLKELVAKKDKEELKKLAPSLAQMLEREEPVNITQAMSSALETLRSGHTLIRSDLTPAEAKKMDAIKNSFLYHYGNICIQDADYGIKQKLTARKNFDAQGGFKSLDRDEKLDLIMRMIYESCPNRMKEKVHRHYGAQFDELFDNGQGVNESRDRAFQKAVFSQKAS